MHSAALDLGCDVLLVLVTDQVTIAEAIATTIIESIDNPRRPLAVTIATLSPLSEVLQFRSLCMCRKLCEEVQCPSRGQHTYSEGSFVRIPNSSRRADVNNPTGGLSDGLASENLFSIHGRHRCSNFAAPIVIAVIAKITRFFRMGSRQALPVA
jgi:hypothetical protein